MLGLFNLLGLWHAKATCTEKSGGKRFGVNQQDQPHQWLAQQCNQVGRRVFHLPVKGWWARVWRITMPGDRSYLLELLRGV